MKQDEIDELLTKEFSPDFNEQIPEHFLSDINFRLDQLEKKKKRRLFLIWFLSFALISGALSFGYLIKVEKTEKPLYVLSKPNNKVKKMSLKQNNVLKQSSVIKTKREYRQVRNEIIKSNLNEPIRQSKSYSLLERNFESKTFEGEISYNNLNFSMDSARSSGYKALQNPETMEKLNLSLNLDSLKNKDIAKEKIKDSVEFVRESKITEEVKKRQTDNPKRFSFGLFSGVSGVFSSINFNDGYTMLASTTDLITYRDIRRQQERMTSSWDLAFRMQFIHRKVTIQSGVEFFEWGEQLVYDFNSISGINRYSYLNLPLNFGYMFEIEKIGINPFAGFSVGYGIRQDGIYLNPDLISTSIVKSEAFSSTFQAGVQFCYGLEQFTVSMIPIYRMSLGPIINQGIVRNSYKSVGLQIGLSYRF